MTQSTFLSPNLPPPGQSGALLLPYTYLWRSFRSEVHLKPREKEVSHRTRHQCEDVCKQDKSEAVGASNNNSSYFSPSIATCGSLLGFHYSFIRSIHSSIEKILQWEDLQQFIKYNNNCINGEDVEWNHVAIVVAKGCSFNYLYSNVLYFTTAFLHYDFQGTYHLYRMVYWWVN